MPNDRQSGYIRLMADHIGPMLPENPVLARRVLSLLAGRLGPRPHYFQMAAAASVVALAMLVLRQDGAEAESGRHARIVEPLSGGVYVVIYESTPGLPTRVIHRVPLTAAEAAKRLKTPGWQREALASFGAL